MNILLVLTDQHRYDIVGANGSPVCRSPSLDRLAAQGTNFQQAYSICPLCTPARATIYTGVAPHKHGLMRNVMVDSPGGHISPDIPTLAERLAPHGYACHFQGKWHAGNRLPRACGWEGMEIEGYGDVRNSRPYRDYLKRRGFDLPEIQAIGGGWAHQLTHAGRLTGPVEASVPSFLTENALEDLQGLARQDRPFFLSVNYWGPHAPYIPSGEYAEMYDPADIEPWGNFEDDFEGKPPIYRRYRDAYIGEGNALRTWEQCARWAALYFGFATQIDAQIGRLLSALDEWGLSDDTAVIFSTDHGDLTGAHGGMHDKHGMLVQELMHVPFITRLPGQANAGIARTEYCSSIDIPATIMDLAGLAVPDTFHGNSVLPLMRGEPAPPDWADHVVAESFGNQFGYESRMVVHQGHKYVFHPGAFDELYDLEHDPWEIKNLINSDAHAEIVRACRRRLLDWLKRTGGDLCVPCGLFEHRDPWTPEEATPYSQKSQDRLRQQPTRLIGEPRTPTGDM